MTASEFTEQQLREIRREFFASYSEKRFWQERNLLVQAITHPADYLNARGVKVPPSKYRAILATVISAIKKHGKRAKIERFSAYLLHSVQKHMQHHGDEYYYAAKEVRPIASMLPKVVGKVQPGEPADTLVPMLAEVNRTLRSKGGRKRAADSKKAAKQPDLFALQG